MGSNELGKLLTVWRNWEKLHSFQTKNKMVFFFISFKFYTAILKIQCSLSLKSAFEKLVLRLSLEITK